LQTEKISRLENLPFFFRKNFPYRFSNFVDLDNFLFRILTGFDLQITSSYFIGWLDSSWDKALYHVALWRRTWN